MDMYSWERGLNEGGTLFRIFSDIEEERGSVICYVPNTHPWSEVFSILLCKTPAFLHQLVEEKSPLIMDLIEELFQGNEHSREIAKRLSRQMGDAFFEDVLQ